MAYNIKHGGTATEFKTLSAGLNTERRFHNAVCTVWSITYLNYWWWFKFKTIEL